MQEIGNKEPRVRTVHTRGVKTNKPPKIKESVFGRL